VDTWSRARTRCRRGFTEVRLLPLIRAHQLPFGENVAFHRCEQILLCRPGLEVENLVEHVELEVVVMRFAGRRHRPTVAEPAEITHALPGSAGDEL